MKMSKLVLFFSLLFLGSRVHAAWIESFNMCSASFTTTSETTRYIPITLPGAVLIRVVVSSVSTAGSLDIYDSSGTANNKIGNISLGTLGSYPYEVLLSSGLTYTTTTNSGGVTLIYKKTRP